MLFAAIGVLELGEIFQRHQERRVGVRGQRHEMHAGDEIAGIRATHRDARVNVERADLRKATAELREKPDHRTTDQRRRAATEQSQCSVVRGGNDTAARQQQRGHRVQIEQFTRSARIGSHDR